jgi:preprotein translocase subunit SecD
MQRRRFLLPLIFILLASGGGLAAVVLTDSSPELGLDLQGGVSVVLEPTEEVDSGQLDVAVDIIRSRVDALGVAEPEIIRQGDAILVQLPGVENRERVLALLGQTAELRFRPVLTQAGASQEACDARDEADEAAAEQAAEEEEQSSTTTTAPAGDATTTTAPAGETTTSAPQGFQAQDDPTTTAPAETTTTAPAGETTTTTAPAGETPTTTVPGGDTSIPLTPRADDVADQEIIVPDQDCATVYQLGPTLTTGEVVGSARAEIDDQSGQWIVALSLRGGDLRDQFNQAATACYGQDQTVCPTGQLAIVLDSEVVSAPSINEPTFGENLVISNQAGMPEGDAKDLALVLRYGSLPVELERQNVETVSATLGEDSLHAGIVAGLVGLALVAGYMILYYRALGLVVVLGMGVWGGLLYTIISWLGTAQGLALTLSGVTGIIVSVGVTVDSYVVYFERLKDEIRSGRTLRTSTERAFKRAFRTILAADISSFLGAGVLWWLTVGSVRGFAFFLGLSTVLDVVVAWFYTRPMVTLLSRNRIFTEARFLGVARGLASSPSKTTAAPAGGGR